MTELTFQAGVIFCGSQVLSQAFDDVYQRYRTIVYAWGVSSCDTRCDELPDAVNVPFTSSAGGASSPVVTCVLMILLTSMSTITVKANRQSSH
jgi:hypothetical protein